MALFPWFSGESLAFNFQRIAFFFALYLKIFANARTVSNVCHNLDWTTSILDCKVERMAHAMNIKRSRLPVGFVLQCQNIYQTCCWLCHSTDHGNDLEEERDASKHPWLILPIFQHLFCLYHTDKHNLQRLQMSVGIHIWCIWWAVGKVDFAHKHH